MRKGIDTTDMVVYGHEAWITTDKNTYAPWETVHAVLRWGHNNRPDGFCRLDEFRAFLVDPQGNRKVLSPKQGNPDALGDYYDIDFVPHGEGVFTIMVIYDNIYGRSDSDEYFEGTRGDFPDIKEVIRYLQPYSACFTVGEPGAQPAFVEDSRISFVPAFPEGMAPDKLTVRLLQDRFPIRQASVTLVYYDGITWFERMMTTDENGTLFFNTEAPGQYCLIYRTGLNEPLPGVYEKKEVTATYTFLKH